jgi:hypothetical protein
MNKNSFNLNSLIVKNNNKVTITPENYHLLKRFKTNRSVIPSHVQRMKLSVMKHGVLRAVIVVFDATDNTYQIIDGQHLIKALIELNMDIDCYVVSVDGEEEKTQLMIDLNNITKSWKLNDYVNSWAESGIKPYQKLRTAATISYPYVQISVLIQAFTQQSRAKATKLVKEGTFDIVNKVRGEEQIECVCDCFDIVPNTRQMNEALIKLMLKTESYNHSHFVKKLKAVVKTYVFSTKEGELYKQLVKIYNN